MKRRLANLAPGFCPLLAALCLPPNARAGSTDPLDLDGLPDLIVDQAALRQHWIVRVEDFSASNCSVIEGGVTPGTHPVVQFMATVRRAWRSSHAPATSPRRRTSSPRTMANCSR